MLSQNVSYLNLKIKKMLKAIMFNRLKAINQQKKAEALLLKERFLKK